MNTLVTGTIFTADDELPWAEAMVIAGDTVTFVGDADDARRLVGKDAHAIDAGDGVVIPGFIDGHAHLLPSGAALTRAALRSAATWDELSNAVREFATANPDSPRVMGVGWLFTAVPDRTPTRQLLDAIVADRPVYLDASDLHSTWCNSAGLRELGITDDTPDPVGGTIVRDVDGVATGHLLENAAHQLAWPTTNRATPADHDRQLQAAIDAYLAAGTTAAVEMAFDDDALQATLRAEAAGGLPFTIVAHWIVHRDDDPANEMAQVERAIELSRRHASGAIRIAGIKLITDGTIDGCTAGMCAPYTNGKPGELIWTPEALEPVVLAADAAGLQIALHAVGDLAVRNALDALELAARRRSERDDTRERRHRIEHLEYVDAIDIARLAPLGVTASMQPVHVDPAYLDNWIDLVGAERAQHGFAWPEYLAHGTRLVFGTDTPTASHQPLPNMFIAATRCSPYVRDKPPLRPDYALPLAEAVKHASRDSAWSCFEESRRGTLRAGLAADFVILDRNVFNADPGELLNTRVERTFVAGEQVFQAS